MWVILLHDASNPEKILGFPLVFVNDRLTCLYSAQQDAVQRSTGWDWICVMVVDQRSSGCRDLSI